MKHIFIVFFLLVSLDGNAGDVQNNCSKTLIDLNDWSELHSTVYTCLNSNSEFIMGIQLLCDVDKIQISIEFSQYLKFKKEYEDALAWYQSLPSSQQGAVARNKVAYAKSAWENLGQKYTIGTALYKVQRTFSVCNHY